MRSSRLRLAAWRLENAPWPSSTTAAALSLVRQRPSDAVLMARLASRDEAPEALEVFSAARSPSERVFRAVRDSIHRNACLSWCLVESLNRLPWYNGLRAFMSLPEQPLSSPSVYCFYMLARNKVFFPTDVCGRLYDYYFHGLWRMLSVAKSGNWHDLHHSVLAVVKLLRTHLENPEPDPFVLYFATLLLGRIGSLASSIHALRNRVAGEYDPLVRITAALALLHLDAADVQELCTDLDRGGQACREAAKTLRALAASRCNDEGSSDYQVSYG
jgi:hypothetical protein